ncbi:unnamed protein product [Didymodactylos carnosus]|uniref:CCR4-NOT transcription complex subunit 10 n=1 Tax=Didymodactylos carnosus TaxID=1234261 RepID=A0A8S2H3K3_9BILA|nr:unnamed protein product [Didymodactylos carnosus]CAF3591931.1 unnamed protein product [Didymodactylos carnosus]
MNTPASIDETPASSNIEQRYVFSEQEKEFALRAKQEYEKGTYESCLKTLNKLLEFCPDDPKVLFNMALTEYALSGFQKTDQFRSSLNKIADRLGCSLDDIETLEDMDHCAIFYSTAIILYHMKQYKAALVITEKLFRFMEPAEESLFWKTCMLLVELDLCTFQPGNALAILMHAEKILNNRLNPPSVVTANSAETNDQQDTTLQQQQSDNNFSEEKFEHIRMQISLSSPILSYLRANFEYLKENYQRSLKIITTQINHNENTLLEIGVSLQTVFYNNLGCIHYYMKKYCFGAFYFRKALTENNHVLMELNKVQSCGISGKPLIALGSNRKYEILYNLGVQLLFEREPYAAFECLIEVVRLYHTNIRLWLRLAECCIQAYKSTNDDIFKLDEKLKCVSKTIGTGLYHKLVLGNCNKYLKQTTDTSTNSNSTANNNSTSQSSSTPPPQQQQSTPNNNVVSCSMEFAQLCLRNAMGLLPNITDADLQTEEVKLYPSSPTNPIRATEMICLKCSILTASAYVSLCLNDYQNAYSYSLALLKETRASAGHKYLARLYLAESLLLLNNIDQSLVQLDPELVKTDQDLSFKISLTSPNTIEKEEKLESQDSISEAKVDLFSWSPKEARVGQAIIHYNIAVIYATVGDIDRAFKSFNLFVNLFGKTQPAHSFQLKFYLDLLDGNRQRLQVLLKEHFGHMTTNKTFMVRSTQLNSSVPLSTQPQLQQTQTASASSSAPILNKLLL